VIQVKAGVDTHNIAQIFFSKKDGSLFVSFPYFAHSAGLLSIATLSAGRMADTINLQPCGKCASHLVKYAHHPDGEAHFSQDGKVISMIRRRSIPLRSFHGHFFTLLVQGLHKFRAAQQPKDFAAP
jgi:hypothetical protein